MLHSLKKVFWLGLLAGGWQAAYGFSLLGPVNEAYQVNVIGYNLPGDIGAPKNLGQEYRRNTPVMYYTCDANFWDYFGARGVAEIDKAFGVFNALPRASDLSADLSEFPYAARRKNYKAEALSLLDLKSITMTLIIEQLGLAEPDRYIWTLHNRWLQPNTTCPFGELYFVIKRNFDPIIGTSLDQLKPTSYLNGTLYSYQIPEFCNAPLPPQAWAQPVPVDALADTTTAIASGFIFNNLFTFSPYGTYFTGLTYDDLGGLRYLYRTNNMNVESAGPNTVTLVTNYVPQLLATSDLGLLSSQALTNAPGALLALYPNLTILTTSNYFVNVRTTNTTAYFTNNPWDPIGTPAHLAFVTNVTTAVAARYVHTLGNVVQLVPEEDGWITVPISTLPVQNGRPWVTIETSSVGVSNPPWAPAGTLITLTNTSDVTYKTNGVVGDYFILPTNLCEIGIINAQLTNVIRFTNVLTAATNFSTTNLFGGTNANTVLSFSQNIITYFTNHTFVIYPVICDPTNVALRQGIEKVTFIRRDYDSLVTRFFAPLTNEYILNDVTNFAIIPHIVRRTITGPDILLTARDMASGPDQDPRTTGPSWGRNITYNTNNSNIGIAGPGTLEGWNGAGPGSTFVFNNVGPIYENLGLINTNAFLTELTQIPLDLWGSFDGTTNSPVVYPNDASITEMELQVLVQVSPPYLPAGFLGVDYFTSLDVQSASANWHSPAYWALAPGSPALPPGLQIMTGGNGTGLIFGTPQRTGTFDFIIRVVDSQGHSVDRSYSLRINQPQ